MDNCRRTGNKNQYARLTDHWERGWSGKCFSRDEGGMKVGNSFGLVQNLMLNTLLSMPKGGSKGFPSI